MLYSQYYHNMKLILIKNFNHKEFKKMQKKNYLLLFLCSMIIPQSCFSIYHSHENIITRHKKLSVGAGLLLTGAGLSLLRNNELIRRAFGSVLTFSGASLALYSIFYKQNNTTKFHSDPLSSSSFSSSNNPTQQSLLFIGLDLPPAIQNECLTLYKDLKKLENNNQILLSQAKEVQADDFHITLWQNYRQPTAECTKAKESLNKNWKKNNIQIPYADFITKEFTAWPIANNPELGHFLVLTFALKNFDANNFDTTILGGHLGNRTHAFTPHITIAKIAADKHNDIKIDALTTLMNDKVKDKDNFSHLNQEQALNRITFSINDQIEYYNLSVDNIG